jgi:hypothetical protein
MFGVVVMIVMVAGVLCGSKFRDGEKVVRYNHPLGDTCYLLDLVAMNIVEEGVAGPMTDKHDDVNRDASEEHSHCCHGPNGMGADILRIEAQYDRILGMTSPHDVLTVMSAFVLKLPLTLIPHSESMHAVLLVCTPTGWLVYTHAYTCFSTESVHSYWQSRMWIDKLAQAKPEIRIFSQVGSKVKLNCFCVHWSHQLPTTLPNSIAFSKPSLTLSSLVLGRLLSVSSLFP